MSISSPTAINFSQEASDLLPELQALRRKLHQIPERDLHLPMTQEAILQALSDLDLEIHLGDALSSITAVLHGAKPGPTVLLRGDMDALSVEEKSGVDFASNNGSMHACGHDLHMSGLVGAARLLSAHRDELAGDVVFMFQPGEEGAGGAAIMLKEGLLDVTGTKPIAAYGIHVWSSLPAGTFWTRRGPLMASANVLTINVTGRGGHSSSPFTSIDPVPVACEIVLALQSLVTRMNNVFQPVVLTVTQLRGATAPNAIPNTAELVASVRTLSDSVTDNLDAQLHQVAENIAAAHQCTADVNLRRHYPVTDNDAEYAESAISALKETFGEDRVVEAPNPIMGSEDFSYVLREVPGVFILLGALEPDLDPETAPTNHSPNVRFNDAVLGDEAAALAMLAARHLMTEPR